MRAESPGSVNARVRPIAAGPPHSSAVRFGVSDPPACRESGPGANGGWPAFTALGAEKAVDDAAGAAY